MLGFGALGELALGEIPAEQAVTPVVTIDQPYNTPWEVPRKTMFRKVMAVATIAAITAGAIGPPPVIIPPKLDGYLTPLSEPVRLTLKRGRHPAWAPFTAQTVLNLEDIDADKWYAPWSEPKRFPRQFPTQEQLEQPEPFAPPTVSFAYFNALSQPQKLTKQGLPAGQQLDQPDTFAPPTVSFSYFNPLSQPQKLTKPGLPTALQFAVTSYPYTPTPEFTEFAFYAQWADPVRVKRDPKSAIALAASGAFTPYLPASAYPGQPWHTPWSEPKRFRVLPTALHPYEFNEYFLAEPEINFGYYAPWSEPKRFPRGLPVYEQMDQPDAFSPPTINYGYYAPFSEPKRFKVTRPALNPYEFSAYFTPQLQVPFSPLSEPKRFRVMQAALNPYEFSGYFTPTPEVSFGYYGPFSEPKRFLKGLPAHQQMVQPVVFQPPLVSFAYFNALSQPRKLTKNALPTPEQMVQPGTFAPPVVSFGYYAPLTEPKRFKRALPTGEQQYAAYTSFIPFFANANMGWFAPMSEPKRFPKGMKVWLQSTVAWPPRLLPTPVIVSIMMAATETNADQAEFVYIVAGAPASAKVSIIEGPRDAAATSIVES